MAKPPLHKRPFIWLLITTLVGIIGAVVAEPLKNYFSNQSAQSSSAPKTAIVNTQTSVQQLETISPLDGNFSVESLAARKAFRHQLRPLTAAESSLKIDKIPNNAFGFSSEHLFKYSDFKVDRFPSYFLYFEIHKILPSEIYALAFVNADAKRKLELSSSITEPVTLYSDRWNDAPYAVRVLINSCANPEQRGITLDDRNILYAVDCDVKVKK